MFENMSKKTEGSRFCCCDGKAAPRLKDGSGKLGRAPCWLRRRPCRLDCLSKGIVLARPRVGMRDAGILDAVCRTFVYVYIL